MSDSDTKTPDQPGPKAPVVSEEIVVTPTGKSVVVVRGEGGKFQKKKKTAPETKEIVRYMRELLSKPEADADGRITRGSKTRLRKMFDNIYSIATMDPESPVFDRKGEIIKDEEGKILYVKDAKMAMASTQAFKELMLRVYGMPSKSDEELDAMKKDGVKIVVIAPPEMVNKEIVEEPSEKPKERLAPSFIDAEFVENKQ